MRNRFANKNLIKLSSGINISSKKIKFKGKKSRKHKKLKKAFKDTSKGLTKALPKLIASIPRSVGKKNKNKAIRKLLGSIPVCAGVAINKIKDDRFIVDYKNVSNRLRNAAKPAKKRLSLMQAKEKVKDFTKKIMINSNPILNYSNKAIVQLFLKDAKIQKFILGIRTNMCAFTGDPVNANTGNFIYVKDDLRIEGKIPLIFTRYYNSKDDKEGGFTKGWRHSFETSIKLEKNICCICFPDGQEEYFFTEDERDFTPVFNKLCSLEKAEDIFTYKAEGFCYIFDKEGLIRKIFNEAGESINFSYDDKKRLIKVSNSYDVYICLLYDNVSRIKSIEDHAGRKVEYGYEEGNLASVSDMERNTYRYFYEEGILKAIENPLKVKVLENKYDKMRRVIEQIFADGGSIYYEYDDENNQTFVRNQCGYVEIYKHDGSYKNITSEIENKEAFFKYDENNLLCLYTDKQGNNTSYEYDDKGNLIKVVYADEEIRKFNYDNRGKLKEVVIDGNRVQSFEYDNEGRIIKEIDALGNEANIEYNEDKSTIIYPDERVLEIKYDKKKNIESLEDTDGVVVSYVYDKLNQVVQIEDAEGNKSNIVYNNRGLIKEASNALEERLKFEYTENGKLKSVEDRNKAKTSYSYTDTNNVESITLPENTKVKMEYDLMQNLIKRTYPDGGSEEYIYDEENRIVAQILPNKGVYEYSYDDLGNITAIKDPLGEVEFFSYDKRGRLLSSSNKEGCTTTYEYGKNHISVTDILGNNTIYEYDKAGRLISESNTLNGKTEYERDKIGRIISVKEKGKVVLECEYKNGSLYKKTYKDGSWEKFYYNRNKKLIKRENDKNQSMIFTLDKIGRVTEISNSLGQRISYEYDPIGNITKITDSLGNVTEYEYSVQGNLIGVIDAIGNRTEYGYDKMGRLIIILRHESKFYLLKSLCAKADKEMKSLRNIVENEEKEKKLRLTEYERDYVGNITAVVNPLGYKETYNYDLLGRVIKKTDREGFEIEYEYTVLGDIKRVVYVGESEVKFEYNAKRELSKVSGSLGDIEFERDKRGYISIARDTNGNETHYVYGEKGELISKAYPNGKRVEYEYDEDLNLAKLKTDGKEVGYSYDNYGRLISKKLPSGIESSYEYNDMGLLGELTHKKNSRIIEKYTYGYDLMGNKTKVIKKRSSGIEEGVNIDIPKDIQEKIWKEEGEYTYSYDALSRLTQVFRNNKILEEYIYDAFGNRVRKKTEKGDILYKYNEADELVKEEGGLFSKNYEYDKRGNLVKIYKGGNSVESYKYDVSGRLALSFNEKEIACYQYDGLGNRIEASRYKPEDILPKEDINYSVYSKRAKEKDVKGKELEHVSKELIKKALPVYKESYTLDLTRPYHNILQRLSIEGLVKKEQSYVWDINTVLMEEGGNTVVYLQDDLGSTIRIMELENEKEEIYGYSAFGEDLYKTQGNKQPFGYTGYRYDNISETYCAQAREYIPSIGRFAGEDLIKGYMASPYTMNSYGYCYGNPLRFVDRDGKKPAECYDDFMAYKSLEIHKKPEILYKPGVITPTPSTSPYVGVFFLNEKGGAGGAGHVAIMLVHEDRTGDLYSFTGTTGIPEVLTAVAGYNDANVDYMMGVKLDTLFREYKGEGSDEGEDEGYQIRARSRDGEYIIGKGRTRVKHSYVKYNRGIYFNIDNEDGEAIAEAAIKTMKEVNGSGTDIRDYNVFWYNCNVKAKDWLSMAGINIDPENKWYPNDSYTCTEKLVLETNQYNKWNPECGDLYNIWMKVEKTLPVSKKQGRCPLSE